MATSKGKRRVKGGFEAALVVNSKKKSRANSLASSQSIASPTVSLFPLSVGGDIYVRQHVPPLQPLPLIHPLPPSLAIGDNSIPPPLTYSTYHANNLREMYVLQNSLPNPMPQRQKDKQHDPEIRLQSEDIIAQCEAERQANCFTGSGMWYWFCYTASAGNRNGSCFSWSMNHFLHVVQLHSCCCHSEYGNRIQHSFIHSAILSMNHFLHVVQLHSFYHFCILPFHSFIHSTISAIVMLHSEYGSSILSMAANMLDMLSMAAAHSTIKYCFNLQICWSLITNVLVLVINNR
ncbi:hypothetical protein CsSME_00017537 [Camellia sinensis var. sinensis]